MATVRTDPKAPRRFRALPCREVLGGRYPVAATWASRLLGLAHLDRAHAGAGLLLPGCRSVHTFGMRFPLDVWFLGRDGEPLEVRRSVPRRRVVRRAGAIAVLEVPA